MNWFLIWSFGAVCGAFGCWGWLRWWSNRPGGTPLDRLLARESALLEAIPEAVIVMHPDMRIAAWNSAAEKLYGYTRAEAIGQSVSVLLEALPGSMQPDIPRVVLGKGEWWQGRFTTHDKAGTIVPIASSSKIIHDRAGHPIGYIGTDRSLVDQAQFEEQFVHQATLLAAVQDAMIAVDLDRNITEWNRAAEVLYGYSSSEAMGKNLSTLLRTQPDTNLATDPYSSHMRRSGIWQGRLVHQKKTNETVIVSASISVLFAESGAAIGYLSVDRDITAQVEIEHALEKQNVYLHTLNRIALALLDRLDVDALISDILLRASSLVGATDACVYLLDGPSGEMRLKLGLGMTRQLVGRTATIGKGITGKVLRTMQPVNVADYSTWPEGSSDLDLIHLHAIVALPLRSAGRVLGILCLIRDQDGAPFSAADEQILARFGELASIALDNAQLFQANQQEISERRRAERELTRLNAELENRVAERAAELENQRAQLFAIVDAMGEGVVYSENGKIRYANRAIAQLTGHRLDELIDQQRSMLMSDLQMMREAPITSTKARKTWRGETTVHRRDGTDFEAAVTLTHIESNDRAVQNSDVLIMRDITEERQLEEQKAKFIANASHELRTPLTNLKTRLYLLHRQPERHTEHIAVIERVTGRMAQLVDDLLDVTRFERGAIRLFRQPVSLQTLVHDVIEQQRPEAVRKHITLSLDLNPESIIINADSDRLMQVLINLLINAINYTMEGGHINITLRGDETTVVLSIKDTGIGIAPENLSRIFEPFFRASEGTARGTGLGLNIAQEIVRLHGGTLSVESTIGVGSIFSVCLPLDG